MSIVCAVFLGVGSAFFVRLSVRTVLHRARLTHPCPCHLAVLDQDPDCTESHHPALRSGLRAECVLVLFVRSLASKLTLPFVASLCSGRIPHAHPALPLQLLHQVSNFDSPLLKTCVDPFFSLAPSGLVFFLPMTIQIGVSMLASIFIFPSSASVAYVDSVTALLNPLEDFVRSITDLFDSAGEGEASLNEWIALGKTVKDLRIKSSTVGLGAMKGLEGSLGMDISWGRLGAKDLQRLGEKAKNVNQRSGGGQSLNAQAPSHLVSLSDFLTLTSCQSPSSSTSSSQPYCTML